MLRCELLVWYVFAAQLEHTRFAVTVFALIRLPLPQVGCARQLVDRWLLLAMYVLVPHALQVPRTRFEAPERNLPLPQTVWVMQAALKCFPLFINVLAAQAGHVRTFDSDGAEYDCAYPHAGCAAHAVFRCDVDVW